MALLGGWRIAQEFARGSIAIDFDTMTLWMAGHAQQNTVNRYTLPAMGAGTDINTWPIVTPNLIIDPTTWWNTGGYPNGLAFWQGKPWVAPRIYYAGGEQATRPVRLYAIDGEILELPTLRAQAFAGFVKRGPGLDPYIGCGGSESGQGSVSGPTLATLGEQVLISYGWPALPGDGTPPTYWNDRAPRPPNYTPLIGYANLADPSPGVPGDSWMGWVPRTINGELQGRWASDRIWSGGLVLPDGITYWAWLGTGDLDYRTQWYTFSGGGDFDKTYVYRYDPSTFQFLGYEAATEFDQAPPMNAAIHAVVGQELGPDGKVYLAHGYQWQSGAFPTDVALKVFDGPTIPPPGPPPPGVATSWYARQLYGRR